MWKHLNGIMVDVATIAKSADSGIMSIGAVQFDVDENKIFNEFKVNLNFRDGIKRFGLAKDKETIEWWSSRNPKELNQMTNDAVPYDEGIETFIDWVHSIKPKMVWTRGGHFDIPIIVTSIQRATNRSAPWFYNISDALTIQNAFAADFTPGNSDLPISRATEQAQFVMDFFNSLAGE